MAVARASRKSPAATCNLFVKVKRCFVCAPPPVIEPRDETTVLPRCLSRPRTRRNFGNLFCPRRYSRHPRAHPQDSSKMKVCTFQTAKRKSPRVPGVTAEMEGRGGEGELRTIVHDEEQKRGRGRKKKGGKKKEKNTEPRPASRRFETRDKERERILRITYIHLSVHRSLTARERTRDVERVNRIGTRRPSGNIHEKKFLPRFFSCFYGSDHRGIADTARVPHSLTPPPRALALLLRLMIKARRAGTRARALEYLV